MAAPQGQPALKPPSRAGQLAIGAAFAITGVATVLVGPLLPELARRYQLDDAGLAWLFPAQYAASVVGSLLADRFADGALRHGFLALGAGIALLAHGGAAACLLAFALVGLGVGLVCTAANLVSARGEVATRGRRLAWVNFAWGLGAAFSSVLYVRTREALGFEGALDLLALLLGACWLALCLLPLAPRDPTAAEPERRPPGDRPHLIAVACLLFLYTGSENCWGGWLVKIADELPGEPAAYWLASLFWGALLVGRGLAPFFLARVSELRWMWVSLALATAGGVGTLAAPNRPALAVAATLTGFGLSAIFPLVVSQLSAVTLERGRRESGWVFAFTGLGGSCLPWLVGTSAAWTGATLQHGLLVPLSALGLFALLLARFVRRAGLEA